MPKINNWEDGDEVEEQTQLKQAREKTSVKLRRKRENSDDKKIRTNTKSNSR